MWQTIETPVCDGFWCPGRDSNSQHLAAVASGTTASAKIAPPGHKQQTIENPPVSGFGVPGGNRTRNTSRHQHLKLACLPNFTTGTYWRCRCDSNACAGFHRPGRLATCSRHHLGTAPYDGVPRFVHRDIRYRPAAPKQAAATMKGAFCVVRPRGFEPPTHGLEVRCACT